MSEKTSEFLYDQLRRLLKKIQKSDSVYWEKKVQKIIGNINPASETIGFHNETLFENNSDDLFKTLFNKSTDPTLVIENQQFVECNDAALSYLKYATKNEIIGKTPFELSPEFQPDGQQSREKAIRIINDSKNTGSARFEWVHLNSLDEELIVDVSLTRININNNTRLYTVWRDMTEQKKASKALAVSEKQLKLATESALLGIWELDLVNNRLYWDDRMYQLYGIDKKDFGGAYEAWQKGVHPDDIIAADKKVKDAISGTTDFHTEFRVVWPDGQIRHIEAHAIVEKDKNAIPFRMTGVNWDITNRKQAENALIRSESEFRLVWEKSPVGLRLTDSKGVVIRVNDVYCQMVGKPKNEIIGRELSLVYWSDKKNYILNKHIERFNTNTVKPSFEQEIKLWNGKKIWVEVQNSFFKTKNDKTLLLGTFTEITGRKIVEEKMKNSLAEKEILLKEIHHRVKNNLQIIASLLNLQSFKIKDENILNLFNDSRNRIHAMAAVHEKLYQSENFAQINFKSYIQDAIQTIYNASILKKHISLELELSDLVLSIDDAIPLALIINELLTNTMKYAFPKANEGKIFISFTSTDDNGYQLVFKDNGVGLPGALNFDTAKTLGLHLIKMLAEQINGQASFEQNEWTVFIITFKGYGYKK